ncbi:MAG TPA: phosphopantetheine-binding protein [Spirochaetota bacterium]|nr:phosphopantetheine-binding protein [Spirochaetota bacterium]HPI87702.1 phosphopantetheine-binding protein [Spirochaetota bacterium]HPR48173.1 phosphopantetheine-binding protein [Spirochaetota bacterium]
MEELLQELRTRIIETLDLVDVTESDIDPDHHLVGGDLGIDSIDVLELVVMIEKEYGVHIESREIGEKVFASLRALASYILENSPRLKK